MSSRGKNFRRRSEADDVDGDENKIDNNSKPSTPAKPKSQNNRQTPKLSFADEDDVTPPARHSSIKDHSGSRSSKSSFSSSSYHQHKISSSKDRTVSSSPSIPSNVQPQAGEYTKEKLQELQKNTRTLGSSKLSSEAKPAEPIIVLKGLVKPPSASKTEKGEEVKDQEVDDESALKDETEDWLMRLGIDKDRGSGLIGPPIPDLAMIAAIRAKREQMRHSRSAAPDYISLDGGTRRAVSGGGSSDDEPDLRTSVPLLGDKMVVGNTKKGVFDSVDEMAVDISLKDDDYEDEEEKIWEEEQFRKGLGKGINNASNIVNNGVLTPLLEASALQQQQPYLHLESTHQPPFAPVPIEVSRSAEVLSISQQAEVATRALKESMNRLRETCGRTVSSLARSEENISSSLSKISDLEKSLSVASKEFVFMQELRDFISITCEFLQDKAPLIEEAEEQMQKLHEERASAILERRAADIADEMMEVEPAMKAALSVLSKGSGSAALLSAASTAAQAALSSVRERSDLAVQLDEFGRDVNLQKRMDLNRRVEARKRRKARAATKRMSDNVHIEGESSTDESDSESSNAYRSSRDELLRAADMIFSDAAEEYSDLSILKEKLETWKRCYSLSYKNAYMSLSAPAMFSPYVRLELLKWDPLYEDIGFVDMKWHSLLFDYGISKNEEDMDPNDPDNDLVPGLVEKIALPILHHEIVHCWDMLSTRGTRNAVSATRLIVDYVPASSDSLRELLSAIQSRLSDAIMKIDVPTWSTHLIKVVPSAGQIAAYRFGTSIRLLRNICLWREILAMPILEKLALEELMCGKILPHVRSVMNSIHDAVTRTERVVASLSGVWSGPKVVGERTLKLQSLVDCVVEMGKRVERRQASGGASEEETLGLARRLKKMMVDLNEYDKARSIAKAFHLKEAL
ncbi:hypothetical protein QJS10_CPA03g02254 [Acorus calamus]|uniref:GCF C-terminal domain-containing protein n=1 Tax=Acorus calamus TaxID=4465 RepID=A0AAV9F454_ACOCL|nr:hypothetical protein QJS10_CPA03g02254 [Acorus calamus]